MRFVPDRVAHRFLIGLPSRSGMSGTHQPCSVPSYTSTFAGTFAAANASLSFVLRVGLLRVVVRRDSRQTAGLDLRREQVRARRLVGDEPAAVERRAGADAIRRPPRPARPWPAHAVAEAPARALVFTNGWRVEEGDEGARVARDGVVRERRRNPSSFLRAAGSWKSKSGPCPARASSGRRD